MTPENSIDQSFEFVAIMGPNGKFLNEDGDGQSTWLTWHESPMDAKRIDVFNPDEPLRDAGYYHSWPKLPLGCKAVWVNVNTSAWIRTTRRKNV